MSAPTFPWEEVADVCLHPLMQGTGEVRAKCRLEVRLGNGTTIEVCRLCWEQVTPQAPAAPAAAP